MAFPDIIASIGPEWQPDLALELARQCETAYQDGPIVRRLARGDGYRTGHLVSAGATQVALLGHPRIIVVAFRGTDAPRDWLEDGHFKLVATEFFHGQIHAGFLRQYGRISEELRERVQALREEFPEAALVVSGHSLGGALAYLAALELALWGSVAALYTFAAPRLGDVAFARQVEETFPNAIRVVVKGDLVPRVPPGRWGYKHPGSVRMLEVSDAGVALQEERQWQWHRAEEALTDDDAHGLFGRLREFVRDHRSLHSIRTYINALDALIRPAKAA